MTPHQQAAFIAWVFPFIRDIADAAIVLAVLLVTGLALFNALRWAV